MMVKFIIRLAQDQYVFKKEYIEYIINCCAEKAENTISISAQPNGHPHFWTIITFAIAFSLAKAFNERGKKATILLEIANTAVDKKMICSNIVYQKSPDKTGKYTEFWLVYKSLLENLKTVVLEF